ncbi:biogenesis of lysosome-related organelles complex 1 subunit 5 [Sitodiplosis mosellana]|uniref:biogenesis of lysosome-related organelles complex 1 subunit 5 n=1 Tax=Sitodiplosis mosellana TaxID=263140 RepID=UPI00244492A4|nr:biogenesis of lysosome-related organelles complex 1 subunit 5 [Sitodiplosis mosellana]
MTSELIKDVNEIYSRIFHHRQFLSGEINYFLREFEQKRNDKEIENLFSSVQNTIEAKDSTVEKCCILSETNLPLLKIKLDETLTLCESVLTRGVNKEAEKRREDNRLARTETWNRFVDDMKHKQSYVENTFEEKEEELREFYSDLERKLHIHK